MIRWGILGCARIAEMQFLPAVKQTKNAEVTALASRKKERAVEVGSRYQIPKIYDTYDELLADPEIDAVYIPLPNHLHKVWTIKAAKSKKHILCEKPIALNINEAKIMIDAANEAHVLLMEAFMYQFHPQWSRLLALIEAGVIGEMKGIYSSFTMMYNDEENYRYNDKMGGGSLYDVGCYCINAARLVFNDEPERYNAMADFTQSGIDQTFCGTLGFPKNRYLQFQSSFEAADQQTFKVVGTEGTIDVVYPFRPDLGDPKLLITKGVTVQELKLDNPNMYTLQIEHFSNCILKNELPSYSLESSLNNMLVVDKLLELAKRNKS